MTMTAVDICNLALSRIGNSIPVVTITGTTTTNQEAVCKLLYPIVRDLVLRDAPWECAQKSATLAGAATGPQGWAYQYTYPSDCAKVLKVMGTASPRVDEPQPFEIIVVSGVRKICTNQAAAVARYTALITDPAEFDQTFINALAYYLASEVAMPLSASPDAAKASLAAYEAIKARVATEQLPETTITDNSSGANTLVGLCNASLLKVGHTKTISDTAENTNEARLFAIMYPKVRDAILRAVPWTFAHRKATLSAASTASAVLNWAYKYTVPADCLMARMLVVTAVDLHDPKERFEVLHDATAGTTLYTNVSSAVLSYTCKITDPLQFDALFTTALICLLAVNMGEAMGSDQNLIKAAQESYNLAVQQGLAQAAQEGFDSGPDGGAVAGTPEQVAIVNTAILRVGGKTITALTEPTPEGRAASQFYLPALDKVLRDLPWNFATRRVVLTDISATVLPATNWAFTYTYPSDCVAAREIVVEGLRLPRNFERIPFEVATAPNGDAVEKVIYTDLEEAELIYTTRMQTEGYFDADFSDALSWKLASELVVPLGKAPALLSYCEGQYRRVLSNAMARNLNEGFEGPEPDAELVTVRG